MNRVTLESILRVLLHGRNSGRIGERIAVRHTIHQTVRKLRTCKE
jgi:hypothetical protein